MRTLRFMLRIVCICGVIAGTAYGAALSPAEVRALFEEGNNLFRKANDLAASDRESARGLYEKSALRFERIVRDGGIENGRLYYNIGNAYFRSGDIGRAILNYRRAERHIPSDPNLRQNLRYARARRADRIDAAQKRRILETLFFWHYDISAGSRSILFAVCFAGLWFGASLRIFVRRPEPAWCVAVCSVLAAALLASLLMETASDRNARPGVVTAREIAARKGDSESYEPAFKEPLHAGTEFIVTERRRDWYCVELADGRTCWLPAKSVELIR